MTKLINAIKSSNVRELIKAATDFNYKAKRNSLEMSNNRLELNEIKAYSYDWWCYVRNIDGLMVFNDHAYSPTTRKHQSAMRSLLSKLGVRIDIYIDTRSSIENFSIRNVQEALNTQLAALEAKLATCKRAKSYKRDRIESDIEYVKDQLNHVAGHSRSKLKVA